MCFPMYCMYGMTLIAKLRLALLLFVHIETFLYKGTGKPHSSQHILPIFYNIEISQGPCPASLPA